MKYAWRVLVVTSIGIMLAGLNSSVMDVSLPAVARHFDATPTEASWILLSYLLVMSSLILVFGRAADIFGRRRLYLFGMSLFTIAGLLCGLSPSPLWLIAFRVLQAVGAAAVITNVTALIADVFPVRMLSTALGISVTVVSTAQLMGPIVGGALVDLLGWRATFWFNVPAGAVGLVMAWCVLRGKPKQQKREPFDLLGAVLSTLAVGGLVFALSAGGISWTSPGVVAGALCFVVSGTAFLLVERRRDFPLVDLGLFTDRERVLAYLSGFLLAVARCAVVVLIALYLQAAAGYSSFEAGMHVTPVALGLASSALIAGFLARRFTARVLSSGGIAVTLAGLTTLAVFFGPSFTGGWLVVCLLAVGVGTGFFTTPNTSAIMAGVKSEQRGVANGIRSALQGAGFVVGTALSLGIATSWLDPDEKRAAFAGSLVGLSDEGFSTLTTGYRAAFSVMAGICALALWASIARKPSSHSGTEVVVSAEASADGLPTSAGYVATSVDSRDQDGRGGELSR
ncbi:EmrB/QacA subfamily drug resistance transporter [Rhodococcus sp. 27YEA15]|uniref:DHA2 family efflux MFS transporter permease subunit n=1 Tax=Rhodococcus sp. 27YEA15 TaxID=3156259 RepID=UPI003C7D7A8F